jgi:hypothetical protein
MYVYIQSSRYSVLEKLIYDTSSNIYICIYMYTYMHTYIHIYMHTYVYVYIIYVLCMNVYVYI